MSTFKPFISADDIERAVRDHVKAWWHEYMAEYERQHALTPRFYAEPRAYEVTSEFTYWAEDYLPHILVLSPGLADEPVKRGSGPMEAMWAVGVICTVGGATRPIIRNNMHAHAAVVRALMVQLPQVSSKDFILSSRWVDETYRDIAAEDSKTLGSSTIHFAITAQPLDPGGKPPQPTPRSDPYANAGPDRPVVGAGKATAEITVVKEIS